MTADQAGTPGQRISGTKVLGRVRTALAPYRALIEPQGKKVAVVRFEASTHSSDSWRLRMEAARISADQKVKAFTHLGLGVEHLVLPTITSEAEFADLIARLNADPATAAVIVQFPPPPRLRDLVQDIAPNKDLDGLLGLRSPQPACATAEGIARLAKPFTDGASVAVVGARGFVGRGVVELLRGDAVQVDELDLGDDLRGVRDADVVISVTGSPGILGREHLRPRHRAVIDSGFVPVGGHLALGDVRRDAYDIPRYITPVPGGVGPVEMAILMERIVRAVADPNVPTWSLDRQDLQPGHREQSAGDPPRTAAQLAALDTAPGAPTPARPPSPDSAARQHRHRNPPPHNPPPRPSR